MGVDTLHRHRIDFKNDITTAVPSNLQKSAVLRALEEEERQTGTRQTSEHQSRSRTRRDVDRETVLRINRHPVRHRSAECVWPPRRLSSSPVPKPLPPKRPPAQTRKLGEGMSHSHQNISEIRDIFENQSNRSESNTLTRLLRGISEKRDTSSGKGEERNIIINDARIDSEQRKNKKNLNTHDNNRKEEHCEVEEEILCKNIHLWPPISSLQSSNLNKARRHDAPKDGNDNVEQIIKRHFPIIDKNYDEIGGKYEKNINFHDWHGKPSSDINDVVDETAKDHQKIPPPPPRSSSKNVDLSRFYLHDMQTTSAPGGCRSSNASPTVSEFTRIYDNIVEPTAYLNISDLESIFSTNTAYSESTQQTTVETVTEISNKISTKNLPPPPKLPSLNEIITSCTARTARNYKRRENNQNNVTIVQSTADFTNNDNNQATAAVSHVIPVDLDESKNTIATNNQSNNNNSNFDENTKGRVVVAASHQHTDEVVDAPHAELTVDANECNQKYLFETSSGSEERCYNNYNNRKFGLDCQNMTNCGNENYNDDKETTAAAAVIEAESAEIIHECERERREVFQLAERIKGKCYTDGEYIVIPYDIFVREFGPICASSSDNNAQTTNFVGAANETEQQQRHVTFESCAMEARKEKTDNLINFNDDDNDYHNNCRSDCVVTSNSETITQLKENTSNDNYAESIDNTIKEIFNELNANLQRARTPTIQPIISHSINVTDTCDSSSETTTTFNIPLIDDIIEDLVLFSQQFLLPEPHSGGTIETSSNVAHKTRNLSEIDRHCRNETTTSTVMEEENDTTTTIDCGIEKDTMMNDEEYEKLFYINNAGLAVVLPPFVHAPMPSKKANNKDKMKQE
ncbi:putative uncharacterized protein DDB_G0291812 isoform X2 [Culicoides brevitarsis]|uniref:putative uncharacterized protein DDB_G0291812 isoform X2 n=1 Tax=Culicoides brevitarsis TaxID=469753 RepID=UPI00307C2055